LAAGLRSNSLSPPPDLAGFKGRELCRIGRGGEKETGSKKGREVGRRKEGQEKEDGNLLLTAYRAIDVPAH